MSSESDELTRLRAENARLIALLDSHGIDWRQDPAPTAASAPLSPEPSTLSTAEKVALFRRLFRGRTDVHPVRWESATTGSAIHWRNSASWGTGRLEFIGKNQPRRFGGIRGGIIGISHFKLLIYMVM